MMYFCSKIIYTISLLVFVNKLASTTTTNGGFIDKIENSKHITEKVCPWDIRKKKQGFKIDYI